MFQTYYDKYDRLRDDRTSVADVGWSEDLIGREITTYKGELVHEIEGYDERNNVVLSRWKKKDGSRASYQTRSVAEGSYFVES